MFDLKKLDGNQVLVGQARHYVMGMADARAEMLQQEVDSAFDSGMELDLVARIDSLETGLINLEDPEGDYVSELKRLDNEFKFLSEPDCVINVATRAAAVTLCKVYLKECNESILDDRLTDKDVEFLRERISFYGKVRHAVMKYVYWMNE